MEKQHQHLRGAIRVAAIVATMATGLLLTACHNDAPEAAPEKMKVETIKLTYQQTSIDYSYPATLKGENDAEIFPQVSGRIIHKYVNPGQRVSKGQVLFQIDDVTYQAAYEVAAANLEMAKAQVNAAQLTLESKQRLFDQNVISDYQLKLAQSELQTAKAQQSQAAAALKNARNDLSFTRITSPSNGIVGDIPYDEGTLVNPAMTQALTTISDNSKIIATITIPEATYLYLQNNGTTKNDLGGEMSLKLTDGSTYAHKGKIQSSSGVLSSSTGSMSINIIYPNPDHQLRSGGGANVIYTYEADSVILVPRSAIKEIQNKAFVFKVNGNTVEQVEVNATRVNDKEWAILPNDDGSISIHEGDIITSTTNRLKNGDEIEIAQ